MPGMNQTELAVPDINNLIALLIGDDTPLRAIEHSEGIYLLNNGEVTQLTEEDRTRTGILELLYGYAVHFGYTNEEFDEFVGG